jgi:ketosteroid isomerase-like protein
MPTSTRLQLVRDAYATYESGDRARLEELLADDLVFSSPADVGIDRARYFERCWPNSELLEAFEFKRLIETDDEVVVTYESTKIGGQRFRNTEVLSFVGEKISRIEVYFGWNLDEAR